MNLKRSFAMVIGLLLGLSLGAEQVDLDVSVSQGYLKAGEKQTTYIKVGLTGFELAGQEERTPVNVAIVIDKSGSMGGDKMEQAKEAAIMAVDRLHSIDIVSIVLYSDTVSVLMPATKVTDRKWIKERISRIMAGGSTALFAGVSKGAEELRKFLDRNRVNRVILLSDGLANAGPDSPRELGGLGYSLSKEGISVTTIGLGLGYNEDLMFELAKRSGGNHAFVENSRDLVRFFDLEFDDVLSVVAQEVEVEIFCADGIRPVRVLGRDADIVGNKVRVNINQIYSLQEKYVLLEVEVPAGEDGQVINLAEVTVRYANMDTKTTDRLSANASVRCSSSESVVKESVNSDVMVEVVMQTATMKNEKALLLRDQGKVEEAQQVLESNASYLQSAAVEFDSERLEDYSISNMESADRLEDEDWDAERKRMRSDQFGNQMQRSY